MPATEREALKVAVAAHKQAIVRRPSPVDLVDEVEAVMADAKKG